MVTKSTSLPAKAKCGKNHTFAAQYEIMRNTYLFFLLLLLASCSMQKKIVDTGFEADAATAAGNHIKALELWEKKITEDELAGRENITLAYDKAGHSALALGDTIKAENHFKLAVYHKTASLATWLFLSDFYRRADNLSLEVMALEGLAEHFPDKPETKNLMPALFKLYAQTQQWEKAVETYFLIEKERPDENLLNTWFNVNKALENKEICNETAANLLSLNPDNLNALEWKAKQSYDLGEKRYQREMDAYEKNKTRKQYAILLKELEKSTNDFKESLKFFERLYKIKPDKSYALYMGNIYARFGDEKNAARYHKLAN
jgi:tetratricopeptide (TPR) repeat protein